MEKVRDKLLNVEQVRERMQCSRRHVYNLIAQGDLAAIRLGIRQGLRIRESEVEKFFDRCIAEEIN